MAAGAARVAWAGLDAGELIDVELLAFDELLDEIDHALHQLHVLKAERWLR